MHEKVILHRLKEQYTRLKPALRYLWEGTLPEMVEVQLSEEVYIPGHELRTTSCSIQLLGYPSAREIVSRQVTEQLVKETTVVEESTDTVVVQAHATFYIRKPNE